MINYSEYHHSLIIIFKKENWFAFFNNVTILVNILIIFNCRERFFRQKRSSVNYQNKKQLECYFSELCQFWEYFTKIQLCILFAPISRFLCISEKNSMNKNCFSFNGLHNSFEKFLPKFFSFQGIGSLVFSARVPKPFFVEDLFQTLTGVVLFPATGFLPFYKISRWKEFWPFNNFWQYFAYFFTFYCHFPRQFLTILRHLLVSFLPF